MTELDIKRLGFTRVNVETDGFNNEAFYYYQLKIDDITLVSSTNLEQTFVVPKWRWSVYVLGMEEGSRFIEQEEVLKFKYWLNYIYWLKELYKLPLSSNEEKAQSKLKTFFENIRSSFKRVLFISN